MGICMCFKVSKRNQSCIDCKSSYRQRIPHSNFLGMQNKKENSKFDLEKSRTCRVFGLKWRLDDIECRPSSPVSMFYRKEILGRAHRLLFNCLKHSQVYTRYRVTCYLHTWSSLDQRNFCKVSVTLQALSILCKSACKWTPRDYLVRCK